MPHYASSLAAAVQFTAGSRDTGLIDFAADGALHSGLARNETVVIDQVAYYSLGPAHQCDLWLENDVSPAYRVILLSAIVNNFMFQQIYVPREIVAMGLAWHPRTPNNYRLNFTTNGKNGQGSFMVNWHRITDRA